MIDKRLTEIEADINTKIEQEKQETGFNALSTLAQKEIVKMIKQNRAIDKSLSSDKQKYLKYKNFHRNKV